MSDFTKLSLINNIFFDTKQMTFIHSN